MIEPSYIQEGDNWGDAEGIDISCSDYALPDDDEAPEAAGGSLLFECQNQVDASVDNWLIDDLRFDMVFPQVDDAMSGPLPGLVEEVESGILEVSASAEKNMDPSPLTSSLELLNEYSRGFRRLGSDRRKIEPTTTRQSCTEVVCSKLSTEEIMRMAGARFIQSATSESASTFSNPYDLSFSDLSEEEAKDVQLAELLLASAEKVGEKQYESANRLLNQCDSLTSSTGNPVQRVAFYFCKALRGRIDRETGKVNNEAMTVPNLMTPAFLGKIPFCQISQIAGVQAITENVAKAKKIHIIDLRIRNGVHLAVLMQALASRSGRPVQLLKVSAIGTESDQMIEETGNRLSAFARDIRIPFYFKFIKLSSPSDIKEEHFEVDKSEAVAIYSEYAFSSLIAQPSQIDSIMKVIKNIKPCIMVVTEIEANHNSSAFVSRFVEALFYKSAYFDCINACMDTNDPNRMVLESMHFSERIGSLLAFDEGKNRVARNVKIDMWRMCFARFGMVETELSATTMYQAETVLKKYECWESCLFTRDGRSLLLGWKGTPLHSLSTWKFFTKRIIRS